MSINTLGTAVLLFAFSVAPAAAQSEPPSAPDADAAVQTPQPDGIASTGEQGVKPTRGFFKSLAHNLGDDVRHLPRLNTVYWLAAGGALAMSVRPVDRDINAHLVTHSGNPFIAGKYIGLTPTLLGAAVATYAYGRAQSSPRLQHLGMDGIEATILAAGLAEGGKLMVRRERPLRADGTHQPGFSFPSGHATVTFAAASVLQQHLGYRAGIPTYLIASYVAISRLHDNRHYASDVAFGAALGIVVGRSVTWHGRNFYATPTLVPGGGAIVIAHRHA